MTNDSLPLFDNARFHGGGYDPALDDVRLKGGLERVYKFLMEKKRGGGQYAVTLGEITSATGVPEASASAAMRMLRNQYGFVVEKRRRDSQGLWEYWIDGKKQPPKKKLKPIGDPELFGEMMRQIYIMAATDPETESQKRKDFESAVLVWAYSMVMDIEAKQ